MNNHLREIINSIINLADVSDLEQTKEIIKNLEHQINIIKSNRGL